MAGEEMINLTRLGDYNNNMLRDAHILKRSTAYAIDDKVNKGLIYLKCTQAGTTASTALSLSGISVGDTLTDGGAEWEVISVNGVPSGGGGTASGIAIWATGKVYNVNDMVLYEDVMYKCNTQHTSTTFSADASKWDFVYNNIQDWSATTFYKQGATVIYNHKLYQCVTEHTSTSSWDESKWQLIGDYVTAPIKIGEVGYISWQYSLMDNHLALNGGTVNDFQATYPELYDFFDDNNLITTVQADYDDNHALLLYDSSTDTATMPNFLSKTLWGGSTIEEKEAGLPNIKGSFTGEGFVQEYVRSIASGALISNRNSNYNSGHGDASYRANVLDFDASQSNSIYSDLVNTVQPPAIQLIPQIRYKKDTIEATVDSIYNDTPIGTVISYMGTTAPREYLACDGTVYNISTYQALADYINDTFGSYDYFGGDGVTTFAVPDLRGEFLRGTGTNSHTNQGSGANVGIHQDGTEHPNIFKYTDDKIYFVGKGGEIAAALDDYSYTPISDVNNGRVIYNSTTTDSYLQPTVYTSRPTNTSVLYCIKYTKAVIPSEYEDGTPVGRVVFDCILRDGYIKANGAQIEDATIAIPRLLSFVQKYSSQLIASDQATYEANVGLYMYDSNNDILTLPNYIGRFLEGGNSVTSIEAGLPNIKGTDFPFALGSLLHTQTQTITGVNYSTVNSGALRVAGANDSYQPNRSVATTSDSARVLLDRIFFDASQSNSIYSDTVTTVQPSSITLIPQIRY